MKIGIIGSGISGLVTAHLLSRTHAVTLFEADDRLGGHTNTVTVNLAGDELAVDTGFIVFNERNYPGFTRLMRELGVATQPSDMSFSVSDRVNGMEWAGTSLSGIFAQRKNAANPKFLRMLVDIARFQRVAQAHLARPEDPSFTLGDLLATARWSHEFLDDYLIPLGASIWSADPRTFTEYPATTFLRFCNNHGLLRYRDRPAWRTVTGGAQRYVDVISAPLESSIRLATPVDAVLRTGSGASLKLRGGQEFDFDHVVIATHSDQALRLLVDATDEESATLRAIRYQPNTAVLHTDASLMPRRRNAWASWNYVRCSRNDQTATLTYDMNRLQSLQSTEPLLVTLNGIGIDPERVLQTFSYAHPIYDEAAIRAQSSQQDMCSGAVSFAGAYWGYGFHEDGVQSAVRVCKWLGTSW